MTQFVPAAFALSVRQPWAWAIIHAGKDIENRTRAPEGTSRLIGRRVAIHASSGMTRREYEHAVAFMSKLGVEAPRPEALIRGAIIGTIALKDVVSSSESGWYMGGRGLVLSHPAPCEPFALNGCLGFFRIKNRPPAEIREPEPWMGIWPERRRGKVTEVKTQTTPEPQQGNLL